MTSSRNLRLPSKKYSTRELESIREAIEDGVFETDQQFSSTIRAIITAKLSDELKDNQELIIRANDYIAKDFTTVVSVGVSFVPENKDSTIKVLQTLVGFAESSGLSALLRDINVNDLSAQTKAG